MSTDNCVNELMLLRLQKIGGDKLLSKMIDLFIEDAGKKVDCACCAFQEGDLDGVARAVHSLRSSAGNIGADSLVELAGKIENIIRQKADDPLTELVPDLKVQFSNVITVLAEKRKEIGA